MKHSWEPLDKIWGASAILAFKDFVKNFISQLTFMKKSPFGLKPLGLALSYFLCLEFPQTPDCQTPVSFSDAQNSLPSNTLSRDLHSNFFSPLHHAVVRFIACNKDMQMLYSCALDLKPVEAKKESTFSFESKMQTSACWHTVSAPESVICGGVWSRY